MAYQINGKTVAIFFCGLYGTVDPYRFFFVADLLKTFLKDCAKELKRSRRDRCFGSRCDIY